MANQQQQSIRDFADKYSQCNDCHSEPVTHISTQWGVTLCETCAKEHTEFEPVKAIDGKWDHIGVILCGGNDRFCDFMSNYDLYTNTIAKYTSVPAQHYRRYFCEKRIPKLLLIPPQPPEPKEESKTNYQEDGEAPDPVLASYEIVEDPPSPK